MAKATTESKATDEVAAMTAAQAAKAVRIAEKDLFDFRDYGTHVVVVTVDGRKLDSREKVAQ
jgi:hypothetical protein